MHIAGQTEAQAGAAGPATPQKQPVAGCGPWCCPGRQEGPLGQGGWDWSLLPERSRSLAGRWGWRPQGHSWCPRGAGRRRGSRTGWRGQEGGALSAAARGRCPPGPRGASEHSHSRAWLPAAPRKLLPRPTKPSSLSSSVGRGPLALLAPKVSGPPMGCHPAASVPWPLSPPVPSPLGLGLSDRARPAPPSCELTPAERGERLRAGRSLGGRGTHHWPPPEKAGQGTGAKAVHQGYCCSTAPCGTAGRSAGRRAPCSLGGLPVAQSQGSAVGGCTPPQLPTG